MFAYRRTRSANKDVNYVQDSLADIVTQLRNALVLDGVLVSKVVIGTTDTMVAHTLNRVPLGWFVSRKRGLGDIYEVAINASNLTLKSSVAVTCDLWVF